MNRLSRQYPHAALTGEIIAAAIEVQAVLKPGLDEKLYENALCIELEERGLPFSQQPEFPVDYKSRHVGKLRPDLIVEERVIVDAKMAEAFTRAHEAQILGYLAITGLTVGLLLNFKTIPLGKKRIAKTL
ncbi:MAG: GxxExxY protein [Akkermansiaceae bacterium]|nr:GxxExxY protein [Akkermansiaceae bacterium]